jgi:hypothetical protein
MMMISIFRRLSTFASENEERAIADAIAQEEERMRFDDEHGRHSTNDFTTDLLSSYSSNVGIRKPRDRRDYDRQYRFDWCLQLYNYI